MRQVLISLLFAIMFASPLFAAEATATGTTPAEAELGRQTAEEIEKDYKLVKDDTAILRLNTIAKDIAPYTQRPDVVYTCKILDDDSINAMAIPGGIIYVTKGLLNAVESDHELAGVLAHEIAHNSLFHSKRLLEREKTGSIAQLLMVVVSIYAGDGTSNNSDSVNPVQMLSLSQVVKQAIVNGYTIDLEAEADKFAIDYLARSGKYDPVGLYSVLIGFRQMEKRAGRVNLGYVKNHPDPQERLNILQKEFIRLEVPINLWNVVNFRAAVITPEKESTLYTVRLGSVDIISYDSATDPNASARATAATEAINLRLTRRGTEIKRFDVSCYVDITANKAYVKMRNAVVLTLIEADLAANSALSLETLSNTVKQSIQTALFNERLSRGM